MAGQARRSPLTRMQMKALALYEFSDGRITHAQIAAKFGVERSAITRRLTRAKKRLAAAGILLPSGEHRIRPDRRHVVQMSCFTHSND